MKPDIVERIVQYAEELFPKDKIERLNFHDPEGAELTITSNSENAHSITLAFHDTILMQIDDFGFELDDYSPTVERKIKDYLQAAADNRLRVKSSKVLGLPVSKTLDIVEE